MKLPISRDLILHVLWTVGIGSFLAVIDPFGASRGMPPFINWVYWTGFVAYGTLVAYFIVPLIEKVLKAWPPVLHYLALSLILSVFVSAGILAVSMLTSALPPLRFWPKLYGYVWVISVGITVVMVLREQHMNPAQNNGQNFEKRIPAEISGGTLYAINAEDHYLRIRTSRGSALILMRLGDALAELNGMDGLRTHRSWWVARDGVEKIERTNGKVALQLRDGTSTPVSRTYAPALRKAGWFS